MRTTIRLSDALFREIKTYAAKTGTSLNAFFEEAARARLIRGKESRAMARTRLHTFKGRGVRAGVDLSDSASLLDIMEGTRGPL